MDSWAVVAIGVAGWVASLYLFCCGIHLMDEWNRKKRGKAQREVQVEEVQPVQRSAEDVLGGPQAVDRQAP